MARAALGRLAAARLGDHTAAMVDTAARGSQLRYVIVAHRLLVVPSVRFRLGLVLAAAHRASSASVLVYRLLVGVVATRLLERLSLLVVDVAASIPWHVGAVLTHVRVLQLVICIGGVLGSLHI